MIRLGRRAFALTLVGSLLSSASLVRAQTENSSAQTATPLAQTLNVLAQTPNVQPPASPDPSCQAVEQTEAMRADGQYRKARVLLLECVNAQCGGDVRRRCAATLQKLDSVTPSIVVRAEDPAGNDLIDVSVSLGDEPLISSLDGMAVPVDPGEHRFVFRRRGQDAVVQTLTIAQGEKFRAIDVVIGSTPRLALPPISASTASGGSSERAVASATLIGVGVIGVGSYAFLGLRARSGEEALARCRPSCSRGRVDSVDKRYLLANVSLGVGVLALGAATYLLLSGPSDDAVAEPADRGLAIGADANGAFASYAGRF